MTRFFTVLQQSGFTTVFGFATECHWQFADLDNRDIEERMKVIHRQGLWLNKSLCFFTHTNTV